MYKIGSLFSGIGGFELGLERALPARTIWQVEQNKFCQSILKKHWPKSKIYDDVRNITKENVEPVDILCGGFPCQDISVAGKQGGIDGKKSGLWWEFHRIIIELSEGRKKPIVVLENVPNVLRLGGIEVLGSLAQIGYHAEWTIISAKQFGAPHLRKRWFCVAYPNIKRFSSWEHGKRTKRGEKITSTGKMDFMDKNSGKNENTKNQTKKTYWQKNTSQSPLCQLDDGIPKRVARLKALGNAIVPQCSEWIGEQIWKSGILQGENNV